MKRLILVLAVLPALLTSCVVEPGAYAYGQGYDPGYYGGGYYGGGYYGGGYYGGGYYGGGYHGHHHHRPSRPYGTPWASRDDVRLNANHRTSPNYRDPHNAGISHNHDAAGNRIDSRGHPVDAVGNHTSSSGSGSHNHGAGPRGGIDRSGPSSPAPRMSAPASASSPAPARSSPPPSSGGSVRNDKASHAQSRR